MGIHVVTGPPCAGKSTYVQENRADKDVLVDYDLIAQALGSTTAHESQGAIRTCALSARDRATDLCIERDFDSWVIRTELTADERETFELAGAEFVELAPGEDECIARAEADGRSEDCIEAIRAWYAKHGDKERSMPAKPMEREYRMMAQPFAAPNEDMALKVNSDGGAEVTYQNRFNSEKFVEGYATTFEDPYVLWEEPDWVNSRGELQRGWKYLEIMHEGCMEGADVSDVIFLYDHEGRVYARNRNDTLYIEPQLHGLYVAADLSRTTLAGEMYEDIKAGMVDRMSWAFTVAEEDVEEDEENRTTTFHIRRIKKVFDVSAVSRPADPNTEISAKRAIDGAIEERRLRESQRAERELERRRREIALRARAMSIR